MSAMTRTILESNVKKTCTFGKLIQMSCVPGVDQVWDRW